MPEQVPHGWRAWDEKTRQVASCIQKGMDLVAISRSLRLPFDAIEEHVEQIIKGLGLNRRDTYRSIGRSINEHVPISFLRRNIE